MLFEYAVEPRAIGSNWQNFRFLINLFGFDRGRLISKFPKSWFREVYEASTSFKPVERAKLEVMLSEAKRTKTIASGRSYDPAIGDWLANALAQQALTPFHAIVADANPTRSSAVVVAADVEDQHALVKAERTWWTPRRGVDLALAMAPLLLAARKIVFVDPYFNFGDARCRETLKECLALLPVHGGARVKCEIHCADHDRQAPAHIIEHDAHRWAQSVIPSGMTVSLFVWKEKDQGEDFHARYLLTDIGGINVESGFAAIGSHQNVKLGLLGQDFCNLMLSVFDRQSTVYDLVEPVFEIHADGTVNRI